jgi:site-specific recombinase XerD
MPATGAFAAAKATALEFRPLMHMDEFLDELAARDSSEAYIRTTRNGLTHFANFLQAEGVTHPAEIERRHILRFQAHCNTLISDGTWQLSTSIQTQKKARAWINWLEATRKITDNPWYAIKVGTVRKKPNPVEDDDMLQLWAAHNREAFNSPNGRMDPFSFHRREIILVLLYGWGLRRHELAAITMANMDVRLDQVVVKNKGGGTKLQPYSAEMKKVFQRWSAQRARYAKTGVDALLITQNGDAVSEELIYKIVVELGQKAGIKINPHRLRDTCGTNLLDDGVPIEQVAAMLGHSDVKTALSYAAVTKTQMANAMRNAVDPRLRMFQNTRDLRENV